MMTQMPWRWRELWRCRKKHTGPTIFVIAVEMMGKKEDSFALVEVELLLCSRCRNVARIPKKALA